MFGINAMELLIIAVIILVVVGPERLPEFLYRAGRLLGQFRQVTEEASSELTREFKAAAAQAEAQLTRPPAEPGAGMEPGAQATAEPSAAAGTEAGIDADALPSIAPAARVPPLTGEPLAVEPAGEAPADEIAEAPAEEPRAGA
jgi:sec-independent protein translocase protein TatB